MADSGYAQQRAAIRALERVRVAEERLEERRTEVVLRARRAGLGWVEISKRVGLSLGAVHSRYSRLAQESSQTSDGDGPAEPLKGTGRALRRRTKR
jgi:DNA-directed RNA polymerase specialized sigma24 family protein